MPRKRNTRTIKTRAGKSQVSRNFNFSSLDLSESYVSLVLGAVVVVVFAIVLFFIINSKRIQNIQLNNDTRAKLQQQLDQQMREQTTMKPTASPVAAPIKGTNYTISSGDNLWEIAVRRYGDGGKWVDIARLNKISDPNTVSQGTKLSLPQSFPKPKTYTVKSGDSLWTIAVNTYGDGYRWSEIASLNNISNPDWIWSGQSLILP